VTAAAGAPRSIQVKTIHALMIATALLGGCKKAGEANPNEGKGAQAKEMLAGFVKAGADAAALSNTLRPKPADYDAVFVGDAAAKMKAGLEPLWDSGKLVIKPTADQSDITVIGAAQSDLAKGEGTAQACPGGYKDIAGKIQPKTVIYCAKFVKPGEKHGMNVDGLVWVNGHWAIFPKPWKIIGEKPAGAAPTGAPTGAAPAP
jgi:hypothetical protein